MHTGFVHLHSTLRWVLLIVLVFTTVSFFLKAKNGEAYTKGDNRNSLITLIVTHLQLVIGWVLYFISPMVQGLLATENIMKDTVARYWTVEHALTMTIAVVLITVGRAVGKRKTEDVQKFKTQAIFFGLGLFLILVSIPWPFRAVGVARGWF
jgi:Kef-type K+ transport system membrane component KefB